MKNAMMNRIRLALSSARFNARTLVAVLFAGAIVSACDVHGVSSPGTVQSIVVTPNATLASTGTQQMVAVGLDGDGRVVSITPVWSIAAGGGTINSGGMFTAGTTAGVFTNTVVASVGTISGRASITVTAGAIATITVTPNPATLAAAAKQQFIAVAKDATGNIVQFKPTWSVVAGGGTVDSLGNFTAAGTPGTYTNTLQASNNGIKAFATVIVTVGPLASVTLSPSTDTLGVNTKQQFTAAGMDASGNAVAITPTWSVVAGGGTVDANGLFTAGATAGTYTSTLKATSGTLSATATIVVTAGVVPGALASIIVTPNPATMQINATQQFAAVGKDASGNVLVITPVWSVVNGGGAINATGLFTAGAVANTFANTIKATSGTISGLSTVTIITSAPPPPIVNLAAAAPNGIMAGTAVTCITGGLISADVSISPGNTLTGFGPCVISGVRHLGDAVAAQGQIDLTTAYNTLMGLPCPPANAIVANLGGTTKAAGVYCTAIGIGSTGVLTLDGGGDPNATFVFQAGSSLTTAGSVVLINGAQAKNVYWVIGSSATLGVSSAWQGNILALSSITLVDNATLLGRALARNGAVSLGTNNVITLP